MKPCQRSRTYVFQHRFGIRYSSFRSRSKFGIRVQTSCGRRGSNRCFTIFGLKPNTLNASFRSIRNLEIESRQVAGGGIRTHAFSHVVVRKRTPKVRVFGQVMPLNMLWSEAKHLQFEFSVEVEIWNSSLANLRAAGFEPMPLNLLWSQAEHYKFECSVKVSSWNSSLDKLRAAGFEPMPLNISCFQAKHSNFELFCKVENWSPSIVK